MPSEAVLFVSGLLFGIVTGIIIVGAYNSHLSAECAAKFNVYKCETTYIPIITK